MWKALIYAVCISPAAVIESSSISVYLNENRAAVCVVCTLTSSSHSLGCVVLLHPVSQFDNITVREISTHTAQPHCIRVTGEGNFSAAVFEWRSDGFVGLRPVSVTEILVSNQPTPST